MNLSDAINNCNHLRTDLNTLLSSPDDNAQEIIVTRGRLIRALNVQFNLEVDATKRAAIAASIRHEIYLHKQQLNRRVSKNKADSKSVITQVPSEFALKIRKLATSIQEVKYSKNILHGMVNVGKVAGNTISTAVTVAKAPVVGTLKLGSAIMPVLGKIVVQPLQIPGYLFSKLFNPDAPYNGQGITKVGSFLGNEFGKMLNTLGDAVKKL